MFAHFDPASPQDLSKVHVIPVQTVMDWVAAGQALLIDVRETDEYAEAHIPGAHLMPLSTFQPSKLPDPGDKKLVIHCRSGNRCGLASMKLLAAGYRGEINRMQGGIIAWAQAGGATKHGA
ncbi:MAG: hypothetical protein A2516_08005 [Alphaproteobacteria bacterium RIFOXYD12_FULL_60_8]|nr:MAG: hypothetical protein A2516_08005 [Alphaproteobacteria bacterium RIFOXYD12_FULL_60_8]